MLQPEKGAGLSQERLRVGGTPSAQAGCTWRGAAKCGDTAQLPVSAPPSLLEPTGLRAVYSELPTSGLCM